MTKAITKTASTEVLAQLGSSYPVEPSGMSIILPRLGMCSQDVVEGKGKNMKVVTEAGTFYTDTDTGDKDEDTGKNIWKKTEISAPEVIIFFKRKQLRMYDETTELYTSSPIYDTDDEVIPLFCDKKEVARGTPAELKARYQFTDQDGKVKSKLEENRVLYVLKDGEVFQMNLRGSSMYSLFSYERSVGNVPGTVTQLSSEAMEKGKIRWNKMTFEAVRNITEAEAQQVQEQQEKLKAAISISKASYTNAEKKDELDEMVEEASKALK